MLPGLIRVCALECQIRRQSKVRARSVIHSRRPEAASSRKLNPGRSRMVGSALRCALSQAAVAQRSGGPA
eukprot:10205701-Alexandrium_andersonii.AAC.1